MLLQEEYDIEQLQEREKSIRQLEVREMNDVASYWNKTPLLAFP